jgi:predicted small secreted protein
MLLQGEISMRMKYVYIIVIVLMVSIVLAGCSQSAGKAGNQASPAVQVVPGQAPPLTPVSDNVNGNAPVVAENISSIVAAVKTEPPVVKIGDILTDPRGYDGQTVIVRGKIARECPSGCWFNLQDGNAVIYIDLLPSSIVIPQKTGSSAKVTARVVSEGSDVYLIGSKVEF